MMRMLYQQQQQQQATTFNYDTFNNGATIGPFNNGALLMV